MAGAFVGSCTIVLLLLLILYSINGSIKMPPLRSTVIRRYALLAKKLQKSSFQSSNVTADCC
jgi:hypothetical protein